VPQAGRGLAPSPTKVHLCGQVYPRAPLIDLSSVARDFGFTLNEVNWLGNIVACVYLPMALLVPIIAKRYGLKRCVCTQSCLCGEFFSSRLYSVTLLVSYSCYRDGSVTLGLCGHCPRVVPTPSSLSARWERELFPLTFVPCFLQALSGISQAVFQILGPKYSELWFDPERRTTATRIIFIGTSPFS
jgi:MFS transporter, FLVCR family, MFS-domain-containing protein 7